MAEKSSTSTSIPSDTGHGKAFPPLDPATFAPQLVWLAIAFSLLYFLLARLVLPRISKVMAERRGRIARDLGEAERLRAETDAALKAYEQSQAEARSRAQAIAREMRETLAADGERARNSVDAELATKLAATEKQIEDTKARALAGVNEIAINTVGSIVAKLIGQEATADEVRRALSPPAAE